MQTILKKLKLLPSRLSNWFAKLKDESDNRKFDRLMADSKKCYDVVRKPRFVDSEFFTWFCKYKYSAKVKKIEKLIEKSKDGYKY